MDRYFEEPTATYTETMAYPEPPSESKKAINRAGILIADANTTRDQLNQAQSLVDQFRAAHHWPMLTARVSLTERASKISPDALVVQRLKRMPSIVAKLRNGRVVKVSTMQDLGGCRAILPTLDDVQALRSLYEGQVGHRVFVHTLRNDYIANPKANGYRGLHFVSTYNSPARPEYAGYKVELQFRTQLMHSWATAVEIVDIFSQAGLKASAPDSFETTWDYFFAYASAAMSLEEGTTPPKGSPQTPAAVRQALTDIDSLALIEKIENWSRTMNEVFTEKTKGIYYLLTLDFDNESVAVRQYRNAQEADAAYRESETANSGRIDTVLVAGGSVAQIKAAYPNYFVDSHRFTTYVQNYLR